jgi:hypothetical protein
MENNRTDFYTELLTWKNISLVLLLLFFTISPGYLLIFISDSKLFERLDFLKLLALASSITLPYFLATTISLLFVEIIKSDSDVSEEEKIASVQFYAILGTIVTGLAMIILVVVKVKTHFSIRENILWVSLSGALFIIIVSLLANIDGSSSNIAKQK